MEGMPRKKYPYTLREVDGNGNVRWYFRVGKGKRTRLKGEWGSKEFVADYKRCMAQEDAEPEPTRHTLQWLVDKYQESAAFKGLKPSTQRARANVLKAVCKTGGKMILSKIDRAAIAAGRDRRANTPFAAISYLKIMGYLFAYAVDAGIVKNNPARDVKMPKAKTDGFKPWEAADVEKFYATHPEGSQARLAMDMLLFTGLRRSDIFRIGPQHIKGDVIEYRAGKNDEWVYIPMHPDLKAVLEATKTDHLAYLVTPVHGRPFKSAAAFGNWFGDMCAEAGVEGRAHGLRKTLAQLLAESGNSNSELKARFGWRSDAMANHYTRKADKKRLAISGAAKLNENSLTPQSKLNEGLASDLHVKTDN
ncbi:tyrosine-type recombinase/integrase [Rhizobium bangladeshense]|uniref:tyrosine-type recombinase/integrase n=1 Tax=Rhizobium bangladeshense TaxID=1138189 RepID=UPI001C830021|nr:tyrosine-type recombinase/integrase [Rhizobium bangladeshense]MBX4870626.1 tyrosine-type recombinase/integrase [Rhizobium bangladeshense]MBX4872659.1 tyrosine-type recombinase/integrase [Rhizobium bangladeshense]